MVSFSVIIPAWDEGSHISAVLAAVKKNAASANLADLVVVDNLSRDDTLILAREAGARGIENNSGHRLTIAALRNRGAEATTGEMLAFLDADMIVPPDWLEKSAARFSQGFSGALGFVETVPDNANWVARVWGLRGLFTCRRETPVDFLPGRNLLVTREAFESVGGFDEQLITNEDKDFTFRLVQAGYPVLLLPDPPALHLGCEKGIGEFIRKEFWRQSSTLSFARKHSFCWRTLLNPLMSLGHLTGLAGCIFFALTGASSASALLGLLWVLPSAIIAWRGHLSGTSDAYPWQLFLLTLLRWNVAGAALVWQLKNGGPFRNV